MTRPTALSVVRRVFPRVTRKQAHDLLWDRTGWPWFFRDDPTTEILASLRRLKVTLRLKKVPCDHCNRPVGRNGHQCPACARAWKRREKEGKE